MWDEILEPVPEAQWRSNLAHIAAWLEEFGGTAQVAPPRIEWHAPSTFAGITAIEDPAIDATLGAGLAVDNAARQLTPKQRADGIHERRVESKVRRHRDISRRPESPTAAATGATSSAADAGSDDHVNSTNDAAKSGLDDRRLRRVRRREDVGRRHRRQTKPRSRVGRQRNRLGADPVAAEAAPGGTRRAVGASVAVIIVATDHRATRAVDSHTVTTPLARQGCGRPPPNRAAKSISRVEQPGRRAWRGSCRGPGRPPSPTSAAATCRSCRAPRWPR